MQWDNDILEENYVLISEWNSKSTNDACQDIKKLGSSIELVAFMDECKEALIDCLSNHLPSRH